MAVDKKGKTTKARNKTPASMGSLMVFFKYPEPGFVKTRLAKEIGETEATRAYRTLLNYTLDNVSNVQGAKVVLLYDAPKRSRPKGFETPKTWRHLRQSDGDIGNRFRNAFEHVLQNDPGKAIVIGVDCVGLTPEIMTESFLRLDETDIVLGPSEDGGYYLIGMKDPNLAMGLFRDIPWSTDKVFSATLEKAWTMGLKVHVLPRLFDVDTAKDWLRAQKEDMSISELVSSLGHDGGGPKDA